VYSVHNKLQNDPKFIQQQTPLIMHLFFNWVHDLLVILYHLVVHMFTIGSNQIDALEASVADLQANTSTPAQPVPPTPCQPQHSSRLIRCTCFHVIGHSINDCCTKVLEIGVSLMNKSGLVARHKAGTSTAWGYYMYWIKPMRDSAPMSLVYIHKETWLCYSTSPFRYWLISAYS